MKVSRNDAFRIGVIAGILISHGMDAKSAATVAADMHITLRDGHKFPMSQHRDENYRDVFNNMITHAISTYEKALVITIGNVNQCGEPSRDPYTLEQ